MLQGENAMKRIFTLILTAALLLGLCGCGDYVSLMPGGETAGTEAEADGFAPTSLAELLGWQDFMAGYYDNTPVALSFTGEEGFASPVFDRESIVRACDALRAASVTEELGEAPEGTRADARYTFTMADGTTHTVEFSDGALLYRSTLYAVSGGDALGGVSFPGYGGDFSLFDLYYDSKVTAFAESVESELPVSVGRRANGGAVLSNQDPDMIRQVYELLAGAKVESVEMSPDQNIDLNTVHDYVFTMADGSTQTFTFTGGCLTVQANAVYGTVYYHVSNADELAELSIAASSASAAFEGGMLGDLRNDISRAVRAANGEYVAPGNEAETLGQATRAEESTEESSESGQGGLSVAGIYVSFDIDGTQDYISLTGEDAAEFVRMMGQIEVTDEHMDIAPEGDQMTVSVNLSDWSGPICYFAGGAVQQTVGNWYRCGGTGYDTMRARILEIYQQQLAERDIEGTGE